MMAGNRQEEAVGRNADDRPFSGDFLFQDNVTKEELQVLFWIKSKAVRDFSVGAAASSLLTWAGGSASFGLWAFSRSLDSCIENILSLEGTWMQNELAKIVQEISSIHHDPGRMRLIAKHFYAEPVFDDSASDLPKLRWRHRNFFSDSATSMQRTQDTNDRHRNDDRLYDGDNYQNPRSNAPGNLENKSNEGNRDTNSEGAMKLKGDSVDVGIDTMGDPHYSVFGTTSMAEEIPLSGNKSGQNRVTTRSHRKSRHKHRMRQREAVADVPHA